MFFFLEKRGLHARAFGPSPAALLRQLAPIARKKIPTAPPVGILCRVSVPSWDHPLISSTIDALVSLTAHQTSLNQIAEATPQQRNASFIHHHSLCIWVLSSRFQC